MTSLTRQLKIRIESANLNEKLFENILPVGIGVLASDRVGVSRDPDMSEASGGAGPKSSLETTTRQTHVNILSSSLPGAFPVTPHPAHGSHKSGDDSF
ncbi:MAG: hypothetical protein AAF664_15115 [Planctomycetota bacterium]